MRLSWDKYERSDANGDWRSDWAQTESEFEAGLTLDSGRALAWLSASQAVIQVSGILFIVYACLR